MKRALRIIIPLILAIPARTAATEVPYLTGRVNDYAQILSPETSQMLSDSLREHETSTGNQVVLLTIPTLDGENIEDYSNTVFNTWKLGQKDKNNGILIVVVPDDRYMRIEVGYGLEGTMTDLMSSRIIRNVMTPKFKDGDYNGGIADGVSAVLNVLRGGELSDEIRNDDNTPAQSVAGGIQIPDMPVAERILFGCFIFGIIGLFTVLGIFTPGGTSWFLYFFLIPFWAMFPIIIVGTLGALICLISYLVLFPVAKLFLRRTKWYQKAKKDLHHKGRASIGGFTFSNGGSGSSWSSGGGSSFSGGGGSSGGGGASGSW
ncbi:MAG: TPM domain-containing protein [Bacteroidales bacterium]